MMLAGIDGIKNQIDPGDGVDVDLFELPADELAKLIQYHHPSMTHLMR